jgi:tetratricopeptide (TPR) repeat protein
LSSQKEKLLGSAQKYILKGQLDRAIKDYEQIVSLDPADIRHQQRLAELLVKTNRKDEAIQAFTGIAKHFSDNAHYLKAIAVYKQIQKLDPTNPEISLTLAALNEKQGLAGNAIAEYMAALSAFEKSGETARALKILGSMLAIDPQNLNIHLRLAETTYQRGDKNEAYAEFGRLAINLLKRGDDNNLSRIVDRVATLFPDRTDFSLGLSDTLLASGSHALAVTRLQDLIAQNQENEQAWNLLLAAYRQAGETDQFRDACRRMSGLFPDNPAPRLQLLQSLLDAGLYDEVLAEIARQAERLSRVAPHDLEEFYQQVLIQLPGNAAIQEALRALYTQIGATDKLADIDKRLQQAGSVVSAPPVPPEPLPTAPSVSPEPSLPPVIAADLPPMEWEEELDLSELDDSALLPVQPEVTASPVSAPPPAEPAAVDIELELDLNGDGFPWETAAPESVPPTQEPLEVVGNDFFDLAGELRAETHAEDTAKSPRDKYGMEVFSAFKKGVDQQISKEDSESHYSLGLAYKEMGLLDDAIAEFQVASRSLERRADCLTLQGLCYRDKGELAKAIEIFSSGLALAGLSVEENLNFKYELALSFETTGKRQQAYALYQEIQAVRGDFRDTADKIAALSP